VAPIGLSARRCISGILFHYKNKIMAKKTIETIEVKFLHSPTGKFGLGYNAGETGPVAVALASEIIESGYGEAADSKSLKELEDFRAKAETEAATPDKNPETKAAAKEAKEIIADAKKEAETIVNVTESEAKTVIADAKKEAEAIRNDADKKSESIIDDAKNEAENIIKDATEMAEKIISEAEAAAKEAAAKDLKVNGAQTVETATDKGAATAEKS